MLLRAGWSKVMARPQLNNLAPTISGLTTPTIGSTTVPSVTLGNPELSPFRAKNLDLSCEWYFAEGGLLSVAVFNKDVTNFPQTVSSAATLAELLPPDQYAATLADPDAAAGRMGCRWRQRRWPRPVWRPAIPRLHRAARSKATSSAISRTSPFLPGFWKNFGVQANYTHLTSELQYIVDPGNTLVTATTPARPQVTPPDRLRARRRTRQTSRCTTRRRSGALVRRTPTVRRT